MEAHLPECPKCHAALSPAAANTGGFAPCAGCGTNLWVELYPAAYRPIQRGSSGEAVFLEGESTCFYHEGKRAREVCHACGRFLCALCDCELNSRHFCPGCLDSSRRKGKIQDLETTRVLYGQQAFVLSLIPLYLTGFAAVYLALRYRNSPGSIVTPRRWMLRAALIIGLIQVIGLSIPIALALAE